MKIKNILKSGLIAVTGAIFVATIPGTENIFAKACDGDNCTNTKKDNKNTYDPTKHYIYVDNPEQDVVFTDDTRTKIKIFGRSSAGKRVGAVIFDKTGEPIKHKYFKKNADQGTGNFEIEISTDELKADQTIKIYPFDQRKNGDYWLTKDGKSIYKVTDLPSQICVDITKPVKALQDIKKQIEAKERMERADQRNKAVKDGKEWLGKQTSKTYPEKMKDFRQLLITEKLSKIDASKKDVKKLEKSFEKYGLTKNRKAYEMEMTGAIWIYHELKERNFKNQDDERLKKQSVILMNATLNAADKAAGANAKPEELFKSRLQHLIVMSYACKDLPEKDLFDQMKYKRIRQESFPYSQQANILNPEQMENISKAIKKINDFNTQTNPAEKDFYDLIKTTFYMIEKKEQGELKDIINKGAIDLIKQTGLDAMDPAVQHILKEYPGTSYVDIFFAIIKASKENDHLKEYLSYLLNPDQQNTLFSTDKEGRFWMGGQERKVAQGKNILQETEDDLVLSLLLQGVYISKTI